jgi:hypothetical protein
MREFRVSESEEFQPTGLFILSMDSAPFFNMQASYTSIHGNLSTIVQMGISIMLDSCILLLRVSKINLEFLYS